MKSSRWSLIEAFARSLHASGAPVHHIEEALTRVAARFGSTAEVSATPTNVVLSIDGESRAWRLSPPGLDLARLTGTWTVIAEFLDGARSERSADRAIRKWNHPGYTLPDHTAATAVVAMSGAILLGGSALDAMSALIVGAVTWTAWRTAKHSARMAPVADAVAGFVAALLAGIASTQGASPSVVIIAAVFSLLPGLSLVAAVSEVAAGSWNAGATRSMGVLLTLALLSGGITLAQSVAPDAAGQVHPPVALAWHVPAAAVLTMASMVQLGAPRRDWGVAVVTGLLTTGIAAYLAGTAGSWVAALVAGLAAGLWSARTRIPAQSVVIAGILPMVPGSLSLGGAIALFAGDPDAVATVMVSAAATAMAIVGGLLVARVALPDQLGTSPQTVTRRPRPGARTQNRAVSHTDSASAAARRSRAVR